MANDQETILKAGFALFSLGGNIRVTDIAWCWETDHATPTKGICRALKVIAAVFNVWKSPHPSQRKADDVERGYGIWVRGELPLGFLALEATA